MAGTLVVLSGGQDSTTSLFYAKKFLQGPIHAISFDYGQKHKIELDSARGIAKLAGVESHEVVQLGEGILKSTSPLVDKTRDVGTYARVDDLPGGVEPTFVPGRNALFIVIAANRMVALGADSLVMGVCQADFGGYFDCRQDFITEFSQGLSIGLAGRKDRVPIHVPLMDMSKADSVKLAARMEGCLPALALSHTCYNGTVPPCLKCHACLLRARGFYEAGIPDPLVVACKAEGTLSPETPDHGLLEVSKTAGTTESKEEAPPVRRKTTK